MDTTYLTSLILRNIKLEGKQKRQTTSYLLLPSTLYIIYIDEDHLAINVMMALRLSVRYLTKRSQDRIL